MGRVKTRLIPALGEQGALDLYCAMLRHSLKIAHQWRADELILACTPNVEHPQLRSLGNAFQATLQVQCGADLGARMHHALSAALHHHQIALLIGSDCPSLHVTDLDDARARLVIYEGAGKSGREDLASSTKAAPAQMVFIPATDGGYVLVGATYPCAEVFQRMPWGGSDVMNMTRQRLREKAVNWRELQPHSDIDRVEDLLSLPDSLRKMFPFAPNF